MTIFSITDHLSETDKEIYLDKAARYLAELTYNAQKGEVVYKGQAELADRLGCTRQLVGKIMAEQRIGYSIVGKKRYQFTEYQVLDYLKAA